MMIHLLGALALAPAQGAAPPPGPAAQTSPAPEFEYTILESYGVHAANESGLFGLKGVPTEAALNQLGKEGWELVSVVKATEGSERMLFVFKRRR